MAVGRRQLFVGILSDDIDKGGEPHTAFLDRAVSFLHSGAAIQVRHLTRPGKIIMRDGKLLLIDVTPRAARRWARDARRAHIDLEIDVRVLPQRPEPPQRVAGRKRSPEPTQAVEEPVTPVPPNWQGPRFNPPGDPFRNRRVVHLPGGTVLLDD